MIPPHDHSPATIVRRAAIQAPLGAVVMLIGRPVKIVRRIACMKGELAVIEEMSAVGHALPGQYGLWLAEVVDAAWAAMVARPRKTP